MFLTSRLRCNLTERRQSILWVAVGSILAHNDKLRKKYIIKWYYKLIKKSSDNLGKLQRLGGFAKFI